MTAIAIMVFHKLIRVCADVSTLVLYSSRWFLLL